MHYIMLLLILLSGCATISPTMDTLPDVGSSQVGAVVQPVQNSPEPPDWVLGREHNKFVHAQYPIGWFWRILNWLHNGPNL
jgi:hypothetical protein